MRPVIPGRWDRAQAGHPIDLRLGRPMMVPGGVSRLHKSTIDPRIIRMDGESLRARQAPLKERYKEEPDAALVTLSSRGSLDGEGLTCQVETPCGTVSAGLHPATGGDGDSACSGAMLLDALVACAGVTLRAVASAMGIAVRGGAVIAEADWDARGTLGVDKSTPVGFPNIRLRFELDSDATEDQLATLLKLTERYCVVEQTLKSPPVIISEIVHQASR